MTAPCFVDANVFVHAVDSTEPHKQEVARTLLARLWREQSGRSSVQALNEFYVVASRKLSHVIARETAWRLVEELMLWQPAAIDLELMHGAHDIEARFKLNWWDSLIVAAAQSQHCVRLYTEDMQHGAEFGRVRVCNPFTAQVQELAPPEYVPVSTSSHRPRGRPRKSATP